MYLLSNKFIKAAISAFFVLCFVVNAFCHDPNTANVPLHKWTLANGKHLQGSFLFMKNDAVYLESEQHEVVHFPLSDFSAADQAYAQAHYAQIEHLNQTSSVVAPVIKANSTVSVAKIGLLGLGLLTFVALLTWLFRSKKRKWSLAFALLGLFGAYGFKTQIAETMFGTDPAFIDAAFEPFKPNVHTFWDANYFYVESKGIPTTHNMMTGIVSWQQQVPIPQCYIGANAWPIPLNPVLAATPVPVSPQHFLRGAVAVAANGIAIFNPFTNTGVDAFLDGQLDQWGGHCGRADDYHYHIAPLHLYGTTAPTLPIAFALDGFAIYGPVEPDGTPMLTLDVNHGHFGANGVYHYHGTPEAPYMIGNMVGQVTEDNTLQIVPQAAAHPIRPSLTPLKGATITGCPPNATNNGYTLNYTKSGEAYSVDYSWTPNGKYTFNFISPTGTTTENYNGFVQCSVPTTLTEDFSVENNGLTLFPNPTAGGFSLKLSEKIDVNDVLGVSIFDTRGQLVAHSSKFKQDMQFSNLSKGTYTIQIQLKNQFLTKTLVIQ